MSVRTARAVIEAIDVVQAVTRSRNGLRVIRTGRLATLRGGIRYRLNKEETSNLFSFFRLKSKQVSTSGIAISCEYEGMNRFRLCKYVDYTIQGNSVKEISCKLAIKAATVTAMRKKALRILGLRHESEMIREGTLYGYGLK